MKLVLTGSIAMDRIMIFPGKYADVIQPDKLHVLSLSVLLSELKDTPGGVAANIAYTLALLGESGVLYGSVGKNGQSYMEDLQKLGVDTSLVHYSDLPTATFTVLTDQADCQVGGFYPGAMGDASSLTLEKFDPKEHFIVISPHDPAQMKKQVAECKAKKLRMFYDVGQQANNIPAEDIREGIEAAELLIVNDYEMGVLAKKSGLSEAEIQQKVPACVVTLGEKGCRIHHQWHKDEPIEVKACAVKKVADPTGAGDAFRAGFLFGYIRQWPITQCAQLGAVTAAYAVENMGTQGHAPTKEEILKRYITTYGEPEVRW